ncbi:MAG: hypothetical protein NTW21_08875 [Verrucomicrobia bacterium]|nr:hypothetical protein [Verrucomicrobiota bacterium]
MNGASQGIWPALFPEDDIPRVLQDVLDACKDLKRPGKSEQRPEEAITKQVYEKLRQMPDYRRGPLEPHFESWLPDLDSRADIRFSCGKGIDTYFLVEAKRLFVTFPEGTRNSLVKAYVNQGMMRFIEGRYAPFQEASAMLGYVHDESIATAREALAKEIAIQAESLRLQFGLRPSMLRVSPPVEETCHALNPPRSFTLYHLWVGIPRAQN